MNTLEINKLVGAILVALLVVTGIRILGDALIEPEPLEENVYKVATETEGRPAEEEKAKEEKPAVETPGAKPKETAEAEPAGGPSFAALVKNADVDAGKKVAQKCKACHTFEKGGGARVGPNLYDVVGADKAFAEGFNYSDALKNAEGKWTYEALDKWLDNPGAYLPGNRMPFAGIKDEKDRADLIAYLRTLSDDPEPLP